MKVLDYTVNGWRTMRLDELIIFKQPLSKVEPTANYREITLHQRGGGLSVRREVAGSALVADEMQTLQEGDFVTSIHAFRTGSVAIVPHEFAGAVLSKNFLLFDVRTDLVTGEWLVLVLGSPQVVEVLGRTATGSAHQIYPKKGIFALEVPVPSLAEQRRLVARIEELAGQIHDARTLRCQAGGETDALLNRAASELLDESGWTTKPLGEILAAPPRNGLSPKQQVESGGRGMLRINAVSSSPTRFVDMTALKQVDVPDEVARPFVIQDDDVFIVRYNGDINRVAKPAIYKGANESRIVYPDKLMRLRPERTKMTPDFLVFALSSRSVLDQIEEIGKTTAGNIGISGANAKAFKVPVPPLNEQNRIVAELDALQAEMNALKRLQAETAAELDALLPAILDKAFKGEL